MRYTLYLLGCVLLATLGTVVSISFTGVSLEFSRLIGLLDYATLAWVLAVCLLALLGTGSLRALGRALRAMFLREAPLAAAQAREGLAAWKAVSVSALLAGGLGLLAGLIGMMHSLDGADLSGVGVSLNVACLSLYYGLFLDLLLLPVGAKMKRRLRELDQGERLQGSICVRFSRRKAG